MKKSLIILSLLVVSILLKTTISRYISLNLGTPDFTLIILVYVSIRYGSVTGQFSGFTAGILEDVVSLSPLGFNSLIRTVIGFITGLFHDRLIMDPVIFPILSVSLVSILKGILSFLILELFSVDYSGNVFLTSSFGFELLMNSLLAPFLFQLLRLLLDKLLPERNTL